jgi:outer membrane PBP1 activator LpoA protein
MSEEMLPSPFGWVKKNIKRFVLVAVAAIVFTACSEPTPIEQFPTLVFSTPFGKS